MHAYRSCRHALGMIDGVCRRLPKVLPKCCQHRRSGLFGHEPAIVTDSRLGDECLGNCGAHQDASSEVVWRENASKPKEKSLRRKAFMRERFPCQEKSSCWQMPTLTFSSQKDMSRSSMLFIGHGEPHALRLGMRVHQHPGHILFGQQTPQ